VSHTACADIHILQDDDRCRLQNKARAESVIPTGQSCAFPPHIIILKLNSSNNCVVSCASCVLCCPTEATRQVCAYSSAARGCVYECLQDGKTKIVYVKLKLGMSHYLVTHLLRRPLSRASLQQRASVLTQPSWGWESPRSRQLGLCRD
jgi:hypothetical protein